MKCDCCEDKAELMIHMGNGEEIPICLSHFYYKYRMFEIDNKATITILRDNDVLYKFLTDEVK